MLLRMHLQMLVLTDFPIANGIALVVPLDIADQSKSIFVIRLHNNNDSFIFLVEIEMSVSFYAADFEIKMAYL